jgi:hypothetical protein
MNGVEILGWFATVLLLVGYYLNARKKISSWMIWATGNSIMLIYAYLIDSSSIMFLSFVLVLLNLYGYNSWKKDK